MPFNLYHSFFDNITEKSPEHVYLLVVIYADKNKNDKDNFLKRIIDIGLSPNEIKSLEAVAENKYQIKMPIDKKKYGLKYLEINDKEINVIIPAESNLDRASEIKAAIKEYQDKVNCKNLKGRSVKWLGLTPQEQKDLIHVLESKTPNQSTKNESQIADANNASLITFKEEGVTMTLNPLAPGRIRSNAFFDAKSSSNNQDLKTTTTNAKSLK